MVSPRGEGIRCGLCFEGLDGRMLGKWVWRVDGDAGEGCSKKEVGPNHSLVSVLAVYLL
jgi:hypothetical protein